MPTYLLCLRISLILPETAASSWGSSSKAITSVTLSVGNCLTTRPSIVVALVPCRCATEADAFSLLGTLGRFEGEKG
jgi:hypothetical protein